ncbi:MAG: hypothetical protein WED04_12505 [Promethearchaeati archaeon SRVP18_Atabeyarchaeia-1]
MRGRSKVCEVGGQNIHIPAFLQNDKHYPLRNVRCVSVEIRGRSIVIKPIKEKEERRKK